MTKEKDKKNNSEEKYSIWDKVSPQELTEIEEFSRGYIDFIGECKTERKVVQYLINRLKQKGFVDLSKSPKKIKVGGYLQHHNKVLGIFVPGKTDLKEGFNLIVAHGDSPRLDLKPRCVYEDLSLGLLKTNLYGGLKKFQWLTRPLAMWGFTTLKDGRTLDYTFGEDENEPVLTITDILPHMDRKIQREKRLPDAFPAERLNLLAASVPVKDKDSKNRVKLALLKLLENKWGIKEDDLLSSEIEIVPQGRPRSVGLDGSFIGGYGHDDRISVYTAFEALLDNLKPEKPLIMAVFDREEIGSYGSAGAQSNFIVRLVSAAFQAMEESGCWNGVMASLANSSAISADVEAASDPNFKEVMDELNSAKIGFGICISRYTGGTAKYGATEAHSEFMAKLRNIFDSEKIIWQSSLIGKQEEGGGGTAAIHFSHLGMNIVDAGGSVLCMHSPFEICSKADLWMTYKAYRAFYKRA